DEARYDAGRDAQPTDLPRGIDLNDDLRPLSRHEVADERSETGRAMVFTGEAHGDTDGEEQSEIREDGAPGSGDRWTDRREKRHEADQIRLPQSQEERRDRENGNRQHQCPA